MLLEIFTLVKWSKKKIIEGELKALGSKAELMEQEEFWKGVAQDNSFTAEDVNSAISEVDEGRCRKRKPPRRYDDTTEIVEGDVEGFKIARVELERLESDKRHESVEVEEQSVRSASEISFSIQNADDYIEDLKRQLKQKDGENAKAKNKQLRRIVQRSAKASQSGERLTSVEG